MEQDPLHQRAVEVAKRILSGTQSEHYELGVFEAADNSRLFNDLVELARQLLREEEINHASRATASNLPSLSLSRGNVPLMGTPPRWKCR